MNWHGSVNVPRGTRVEVESLESRLERNGVSATPLCLHSKIVPSEIWNIPPEWAGFESWFDSERFLYAIVAPRLSMMGFVPNCTALFWRVDRSASSIARLMMNTSEPIPESGDYRVLKATSHALNAGGRDGVTYESVIDSPSRGVVRTITDIEVFADEDSQDRAFVIQRTSSVPVLMQAKVPVARILANAGEILDLEKSIG